MIQQPPGNILVHFEFSRYYVDVSTETVYTSVHGRRTQLHYRKVLSERIRKACVQKAKEQLEDELNRG